MSLADPLNPVDVQLANGLGVANGAGFRPIVTGQVVGSFKLLLWGTGFNAKLQTTPDNGTTWIDYPGTARTANDQIAPIYIGCSEQVRITNASGTVNATLIPVP